MIARRFCADELIIFGRHIAYMTSHKNNVCFFVLSLSPSFSASFAVHYYFVLSGRGSVPRLKNFYSDFCHVLWLLWGLFFSGRFVLHVSPSYFHQSEFLSSSSNSAVTVEDSDVSVPPMRLGLRVAYRKCNIVNTSNDWSEALNYSFNILLLAWRH